MSNDFINKRKQLENILDEYKIEMNIDGIKYDPGNIIKKVNENETALIFNQNEKHVFEFMNKFCETDKDTEDIYSACPVKEESNNNDNMIQDEDMMNVEERNGNLENKSNQNKPIYVPRNKMNVDSNPIVDNNNKLSFNMDSEEVSNTNYETNKEIANDSGFKKVNRNMKKRNEDNNSLN